MTKPAFEGSDPEKHLRQMNNPLDVLNGILCQFCDVGSELSASRPYLSSRIASRRIANSGYVRGLGYYRV